MTPHERSRHIAIVNSLVAAAYGITWTELAHILKDCDLPLDVLRHRVADRSLSPNGFWRVDKDKDPELRHTILTLVAFADLEEQIRAQGGDRERGNEAFLKQNGGEGWMLPETLRLADYGLGHGERAEHPQPVASRLGPRFYDWQLAQTAEESWRECEVHAKNLQATGIRSSGAVTPADPTIDKRRVPARGKGRRQEEKGLLALDGLEDEPA